MAGSTPGLCLHPLCCSSTAEHRSSPVPWSLGTQRSDEHHTGLFWGAWHPDADQQLWGTFPSLVLLIRKTSLLLRRPGCRQDVGHRGWGCLFPLTPTDAKVLRALTPPDLHPTNPIFPAVPDPQGPCRPRTPKQLTGDKPT